MMIPHYSRSRVLQLAVALLGSPGATVVPPPELTPAFVNGSIKGRCL